MTANAGPKTINDEVLLLLRLCGDQGDLIRAKLRREKAMTSVITPEPARHDHFKTGQPYAQNNFVVAQFDQREQVLCASAVYTDFTWAEDMATQGCDQSADPAAGMAGRRTCRLKQREKAKPPVIIGDPSVFAIESGITQAY